MTSGVAESIRRGLEEAIAYVKGSADLSLYNVHIPENSAAKATQPKTGMTKVRVRRPSRCPLESLPGDQP